MPKVSAPAGGSRVRPRGKCRYGATCRRAPKCKFSHPGDPGMTEISLRHHQIARVLHETIRRRGFFALFFSLGHQCGVFTIVGEVGLCRF